MPTTYDAARSDLRDGVCYSLGAYTIWGLFPVYLRLLRTVTPLEFVLWRMLLAAGFILAILALRRQWRWLAPTVRSPAILLASFASAAVLSANWFTFVWAVGRGRIVDASLGYFINPLVTIALGRLVLGERLSRARAIAVVLAFLGVLWLTVLLRQIPWIGIILAATFATYGLLRKIAPLGALEGLAVETLLLSPVAILGLLILWHAGTSGFAAAGPGQRLFLLAAGPLTATPLLLFAAGARRLPLSLVGVLQYVGPTLQLLVGVLVGGEPFNGRKLVGYALIWLGFLLASAEALVAERTRRV